jgi:hypothetical protein
VIRLLFGDLSQLSNLKCRSYDNDPRHQADKDDCFALKNASALLWGLINIGDFQRRRTSATSQKKRVIQSTPTPPTFNGTSSRCMVHVYHRDTLLLDKVDRLLHCLHGQRR